MSKRQQQIQAALRHLRRNDPVVKQMIREVGDFRLKLQRDRFHVLVRAIIAQQISTAAARSIRQRLIGLAGNAGVTPQWLATLDAPRLRTAGVSPQKASYLLDLAMRVERGQIDLRNIGRKNNESVIEELIQVRGIGRWTAEMFLIFSLGRLDVFPVDDLGIRSALRNRYGLDELPDKQTSLEIAAKWSPYASVASWYCWRSLDLDAEKR